MTRMKLTMTAILIGGLTLLTEPALAQRSITVLDGARKTPVLCASTITIANNSTAPISCRRLDVAVSAPNAEVATVPANMALALTDIRAFCDLCEGHDFGVSLYGQSGQSMATPPYYLPGAGPIADWHGAGPFLVVLGGSQLRVSANIPANRGDESINVQASGYLTRADQLGQ